MTVYAYRGRTGAGAVAGELEATDRMAAVAQLRSRGVVATAVQEKKAKTGGFPSWASRANRKRCVR
ncbi:MAG: hypothetical protein DME08_04905 [Candidatus Rokuibacteriota bacterium]|nr:MAG: hypothetical protein DME08_04905 [Candidatus Rokubacteria bacterium]